MSEKQTILIIEDDRAISNFISRALTANDYRAITAFTGKAGLSLFFSHGPDLVLLDLGLPDMDGLEILTQLRDLPRDYVVRPGHEEMSSIDEERGWIQSLLEQYP